jgi:PAS domain S-box-containing protein
VKNQDKEADGQSGSKITHAYASLYDQLADIKHFVYSVTRLHGDRDSAAAAISKQVCEMRGGSDNAVWLLTDPRTVEETARNGELTAKEQRRTVDLHSSSEVSRAILDQRVVWVSSSERTQELFPGFQFPMLFPIKGSTGSLGFMVLDNQDQIEAEDYQFVSQFASMILEMSELYRRLEDEIKLRRSLEELLRKERDTAQMYLDVAGVILLAIDKNGKIGLLNRKGSQILGFPSEEIVGKNWFECFIKPADREFVKSVFSQVMESHLDPFTNVEYPVLTKTGEERLIAWNKTIITDDSGLATGSLSSGEDITDRKRAEQEKENLRAQLLQSQKMETMGTLAAGIAHDFNNMLAVILGYSSMLLADKNEKDPGYKGLQKILKTSQDAADLVQRIRIFGRKAEMNLVPLDLNHQVDEVTKLLSSTLPKTIDIEIHLTKDPVIIRADSSQITQMVMNLAVNANEAMPQGGRLSIQTENIVLDDDYCRLLMGVKPGPHVMLTVSDTGRGIDKSLMERIFDPFYSTKTRDYHKGTGLGLSVVQGIMHQHGGHINVESEVGQGTIFRMYFPALEVEKVPEYVEKEIPYPAGGTETILLVEDWEAVRELGVIILEKFGYTVLSACDGQEALDVYEKEQGNISLVILDIIMPRMDGKECLEGLLRINPAVKVIISSGVGYYDLINDIVEIGAKGAVNKPYSMRQLLGMVREVLDAG